MTLVPRGLFGRLVLVLLSGLLLAQLVTAYINLAEREQILFRAGGMQLAQRIGDIARLLDSLPPAERRRVAALFNAPPLLVSLDRPALARAQSDESDMRLAMFRGVLRFSLGNDMPAVVQRREGEPEPRGFARPPSPMGMPMHPMRGPGPGAWPASPGGAYYVVQVALRDGTRVTFDSVLSPQETEMPWRLALTLAVLLGTVIVLALVAVRWVTGPLSALANAAERLGEDINRPPLAESGPLEAQRAARAFNTMQARLARFIADRTRILAAISHDLKTPITRLRLRAEMLEDEALAAKFVKDLGEMEAMVDQTLDFMRDASASEAAQRVDVMALLESVQADYRDTGGAIELEGRIERPILARPRALRRCLANLVDNALRYGARATLRAEDEGARIAIRVLDEGPGIAEDALEKAFEPFYRGEASRSRDTGGTGLGLGIARNIARAHGGDVVLRNRSGGGLEAILTLPRGGAESEPARATAGAG